MPVATVTTSAAGSLALLKDDDRDVRVYALEYLLSIVPQFWAEISEELPYIESLADPQVSELPAEARPLAALLCSKVFFYLGERDEAVEFALRASAAFEKEPYGEFKETIIAGCVDRAIADTNAGNKVDSRLEEIVDGVIRQGSSDGAKLAIGLALSLRRLNLIEAIYLQSTAPSEASSSKAVERKSADGILHDEGLLRYILAETIGGAGGSDAWPDSFRRDLLALLLKLFQRTTPSDYNSITQIWVQLGDAAAAGAGIVDLMNKGGDRGRLEAYQIAFDVTDMAPQSFLETLRTKVAESGWGPDGTSGTEEERTNLEEILNGSRIAELSINFLKKHNQTDMSILKVTKDSLEDRYSIYHSAITFTNAYAHCGTTSDRFLRENLDWLGRASNWAKFSATAALGLIHRGSYINGVRVVRPYLPGGAAPSKFSEGGALFALGLIYTGRKEGAEAELRKGLSDVNDPIVQHGAALGLGVSALATGDEDIYDELKAILFQDNATSSEAAGYAMGLVMLGQPSERVLDELIAYAGETQHEKIVRGVAIGTALIMYGKRTAADSVIDKFTKSNDAILRYGGMFVYALAYVGTGDNKVIKQLLHFAVSDVNDDVRRAAVIALGFVLFRNHTQVPRIVQLLAESYNPHVRHGATLALGISCAGTGLEAAIDMLEPMTRDPVDFVRQGAYIALAMILIQQTEAQTPKVKEIRELFAKVVTDKHEDPMARFGASLAQGIIDAGGRNMTISLATRAGTPDMKAIVGMVLFVQFWYWFPLAHFLGLTFQPTTIIAVDDKLRIPKVDFVSWAKPSKFDYPSTAKPVVEKKKEKVNAAVLSTTAKQQARLKSKKAEQGEAMDTDDKPEASSSKTEAKDKESKPTEAPQAIVSNMSRITPQQLPYVTGPFDPSSVASASKSADAAVSTEALAPPKKGRYLPIRGVGDADAFQADKAAAGRARVGWSGKILLVSDTKPDAEGEYIELDATLWPRGVQEEPAAPAAPEPVAAPSAAAAAAAGLNWDGAIPAAFEYEFED
ncbi:26S proteasome non-ATPase regulatory subunit 1 A [Vanrija pseudolonga]|uniref:26S proteasome regulatory subunit RPN2 n=1 Tax=Vanrija pseudolonga TaxID=143232 RepID=A0AAF0Y9B0_9TREE|nr:26S proteasome non-ATPase regulatory subunit 1 A [Vanrija pseudolonga]